MMRVNYFKLLLVNWSHVTQMMCNCVQKLSKAKDFDRNVDGG